MNQKLSNWASSAEIVSAISVVVTVLFLIVGIQENTAITRVSVYGDLMESITQLEALSLQDADLDRALSAFYDGTTDSLDDAGRRKVDSYIGVFIPEL